jgi:hypothetical protein
VSHALFAPLGAYNEFAKVFSCQVYPTNVFWTKSLELAVGVQLRIFGLTSTILSGKGVPRGIPDDERSLYLGRIQTVLDPIEDVVNLVMCHHPPEWLIDRDRVNDQINGRAPIQLFGHKHAGRITMDSSYLRIGAGAVNPDENELEWRPTYNFIRLDVGGEGADRKLLTETHIMEWQTNPEGYRPRWSGAGQSYKHPIAFPEKRKYVRVTYAELNEQPKAAEISAPIPREVEVEAAMASPDTRRLILRFWNLTSSQRRQVVTKLKLLEEGEIALPEPERYGRALQRAGQRDQLDLLANEITSKERH